MREAALATGKANARPQNGAGLLARVGEATRRHRRTVLAVQWVVIVFYAVLVVVPAFLPLPPEDAHIYDNLRLFAQFVFWGIWWPFVILGTMFMGRAWCGMFCPEGALCEFASRCGLGKPVPRWMTWGGWPFVAFLTVTVYGQLVSVYEYPTAALVVLGGSTIAAIAVGLVFGRGTRVWCRYLCPVSGVFALLSRLAPVHYRVDRQAWNAATLESRWPINCAPMVDIRHMTSSSQCHMCGRCSGFRGAVVLAPRALGREILDLTANEVRRWDAILLIFGLIGVAIGAFQWSASPWFVTMKISVAEWLIEHDSYALLRDDAPWWILTHYPSANDVFTWLDGISIVGYIGGTAGILGGWITLWLWAAQKLLRDPKEIWRLAYSFIPVAGVGAFLGLSMLTVTMLTAEGIALPWLAQIRGALLGLATLGSLALAAKMIFGIQDIRFSRRVAAYSCAVTAVAAVPASWIMMFYVW